MAEVVGVLNVEGKMHGLQEVARECGWWAPYQNLAIIQQRHNVLKRDATGRLHCEDGLACGYPDGWGVYAWHGVRVPRDVIMEPKNITVARIEAERNAELRRVLIERYGWAKYLHDSHAKVIHQDETGKLMRKEIPGDEPLVMVHVINSTPEPDGSVKEYTLRVHPELRPLLKDNRLGEPQEMTARNAVASTFGLKGKDYRPQTET